ncbi:MAG: PAQR family membrane homeostasis protein TrhA [Bdellovibrio sp.]
MLQVHENERFNTFSHFFATIFSGAGSIYLLLRSISSTDLMQFAAFVVYAVSTVGLFGISTFYHGSQGHHRVLFQRMDYMGIYLKIAGNYTPYTVLFLSGNDLILVLGTVWGLALIGILVEYLFEARKRNVALFLYVAMASSILLAAGHFIQRVSMLSLILIGLGYSSYAVGVYFYLNDHRLKWGHEIWHVCVICGSFFQYLPLALYLT